MKNLINLSWGIIAHVKLEREHLVHLPTLRAYYGT